MKSGRSSNKSFLESQHRRQIGMFQNKKPRRQKQHGLRMLAPVEIVETRPLPIPMTMENIKPTRTRYRYTKRSLTKVSLALSLLSLSVFVDLAVAEQRIEEIIVDELIKGILPHILDPNEHVMTVADLNARVEIPHTDKSIVRVKNFTVSTLRSRLKYYSPDLIGVRKANFLPPPTSRADILPYTKLELKSYLDNPSSNPSVDVTCAINLKTGCLDTILQLNKGERKIILDNVNYPVFSRSLLYSEYLFVNNKSVEFYASRNHFPFQVTLKEVPPIIHLHEVNANCHLGSAGLPLFSGVDVKTNYPYQALAIKTQINGKMDEVTWKGDSTVLTNYRYEPSGALSPWTWFGGDRVMSLNAFVYLPNKNCKLEFEDENCLLAETIPNQIRIPSVMWSSHHYSMYPNQQTLIKLNGQNKHRFLYSLNNKHYAAGLPDWITHNVATNHLIVAPTPHFFGLVTLRHATEETQNGTDHHAEQAVHRWIDIEVRPYPTIIEQLLNIANIPIALGLIYLGALSYYYCQSRNQPREVIHEVEFVNDDAKQQLFQHVLNKYQEIFRHPARVEPTGIALAFKRFKNRFVFFDFIEGEENIAQLHQLIKNKILNWQQDESEAILILHAASEVVCEMKYFIRNYKTFRETIDKDFEEDLSNKEMNAYVKEIINKYPTLPESFPSAPKGATMAKEFAEIYRIISNYGKNLGWFYADKRIDQSSFRGMVHLYLLEKTLEHEANKLSRVPRRLRR